MIRFACSQISDFPALHSHAYKPGNDYIRLRNHCGIKPDPRGGKLLYSRFGVKQKTRKFFSLSKALLNASSIIVPGMTFKDVDITRTPMFPWVFGSPINL
jgi:hypothetical protein